MTLVAELQEGFRSNTAEARRQRLAVGRRLSRLLVLVEQSQHCYSRLQLREHARAAFEQLREHARAANAAHAEAAEYADAHAHSEEPQYQ